MEKKYIKVPFDVEMAKRIQNKECEGRIATKKDYHIRVVCWDRKGPAPIIGLIDIGDGSENVEHYYSNGVSLHKHDEENGWNLMLEIPENMAFKDGDIVVTDDKIVVIRNPQIDDLNGLCFRLYAAYDCKSKTLFNCADFINQEKVRYATEEEKETIKLAILESGMPFIYYRDILERIFGIEGCMMYEFEPFDRVLVREDGSSNWCANIFSHKDYKKTHPYCCVNGWYKYCIPYNDKTAHLLGTTENWEETA